MTARELLEIIANGENSALEFKRENIRPEHLAEEIVAFANFEGGTILIGVGDDGFIEGVQREDMEQWLMNICSHNVIPSIIPFYETVQIEGKKVAVLKIPKGPHRPYQTSAGKYFIRVGSTKRLATREDLGRLFQLSGMVHYDITPVPGTGEKDLDMTRLRQYFLEFNYFDILEEPPEQRQRILFNADILSREEERLCVTVGGLLIFGKEPARHLPQSGIAYARFSGEDITSEIMDKKEINGTLPDVVERCATIVKDTLAVPAQIRGMKRQEKDILPPVVIREALVNAVVHRNYSITGSKIRVFRFANRIEVRSPGRLPNTVTIEKMKIGTSYARNPFLLKYMENMRYVDRLGRGIPMIIRLMKNLVGIEPGLEEKGEEFWLTLYLGD
ncbi:histidine kinase [Desulfofundulus thermobenzoicus]|uniref:Histidine kinase n=1 Tax=Desulfofundulus thermobenzoicus TaxID=29376 RepID=A0A6N7IR11_9FIRM|nr:RNA-binding domain-containing protein [Desulfofundulus thermobenzoicus]MQL52506.1 histidine kinase [Desulfofundulus thermobenzoicus]HHW43792.1 histidine kinase [Desulfotomaculum sp.]